MKVDIILKLAQQLSPQQTQLAAKMNRRVENFKKRFNAKMHPAMNITAKRVILPGAEQFIAEQIKSTLPIPQKGHRRGTMPRKIGYPLEKQATLGTELLGSALWSGASSILPALAVLYGSAKKAKLLYPSGNVPPDYALNAKKLAILAGLSGFGLYTGLSGLASLLTKTRDLPEQYNAEHDILKNIFIPGYAQYNLFKRIGNSLHQDPAKTLAIIDAYKDPLRRKLILDYIKQQEKLNKKLEKQSAFPSEYAGSALANTLVGVPASIPLSTLALGAALINTPSYKGIDAYRDLLAGQDKSGLSNFIPGIGTYRMIRRAMLLSSLSEDPEFSKFVEFYKKISKNPIIYSNPLDLIEQLRYIKKYNKSKKRKTSTKRGTAK